MRYNLRPRPPNNLSLHPPPPSRPPGKSGPIKPQLQDETLGASRRTRALPHPHDNRLAVEQKQLDTGVTQSPLISPANVTHADQGSPVLVAASPTNLLTELRDEICLFLDPIEIGRGRSGIVYRVRIRTQLVAIKMMNKVDELEQEIKTYSHLTSCGVRGIIPDVYGYRRWTSSRWRNEFPTLDSWDMPSAGGIFMEYLGPSLIPYYDSGRDIDPSYIAEYLDIMWILRKTHVYHKDVGLNLFVRGSSKTLVLLDFAYSTLSMTSSALETRWKKSAQRVLRDCVCFRASLC